VTTTTTPTRPTTNLVGDTLKETPSGRTVTLLTYDQPWTSTDKYGFVKPADGKEFATIDLKGCAGPADDPRGFNPFDFTLAMSDSTRIETAIVGRDPSLHSAPLQANDCIRGWVTFEVPAGQRPVAVVYTSGRNSAKWVVP